MKFDQISESPMQNNALVPQTCYDVVTAQAGSARWSWLCPVVCYFVRVDHGPKKLSRLPPQQRYWYDAPHFGMQKCCSLDFETDVIESTETTLLSEFVGEDDHTPHNRAVGCTLKNWTERRAVTFVSRHSCLAAFLFGPFLSPHDHPQRGHE